MSNIKKIILTLGLCLYAAPGMAQIPAGTAANTATILGDFSLSTGAIFGTQSYSYAYDIAVDSVSGGGPFIYVRGETGGDKLILKYSKAGVLLSSVTLSDYYGPNSEWVYYGAMTVDYSGNVYVMGEYYDYSRSGYKTPLVRKFDGQLNWLADYPYDTEPSAVWPAGIAADTAGNVYVSAWINYETALLKLSGGSYTVATNPESIWYTYRVGLDGQGFAYVYGEDDTNYAPVVVKFNTATMTSVSTAAISADLINEDFTYVSAVNSAGDVFVLGNKYNNTWDCTVYKFSNSAPDKMGYVSSTTFDSSGYDECKEIAVSSDGNHVYLTGTSQNFGSNDYLTVKLNKNLNFETFYSMESPDYDKAYSVAVDSGNNVYVTGQSYMYNGYSSISNIDTVKYGASAGNARPPVLYWAGYPGYDWNGVQPRVGLTADPFLYRVKYTSMADADPAAGYPVVHIFSNDSEIAGSPYPMVLESGASNVLGKIYKALITLPPGNSYNYKFEARDTVGAYAIGMPVSSRMWDPRVGLGFAGGFDQADGLLFDNGSYIEPKAVAVDTISANGPFVYTLGVITNGGAAAGAAGAAGGAAAGTAVTEVRGDYLLIRSTVSNSVSMSRVYSSTIGSVSSELGVPADLALDQGGNVYTLGGVKDSSLDEALLINKFDKNLVFKSSAIITMTGGVRPVALTLDASNKVYVLGEHYNNITWDYDMAIARLDPGLNPAGTAVFASGHAGTSFDDYPADIAVDKNGNVFVAGYYEEYSAANADTNWVTAKFNNSLAFVSSAVFNGMGRTSRDIAASLAVDPAGNVFVAGYTNNGTSNDILTVKYDNSLAYQSLAFFNAGSMETANSVAVDAAGNVYVAGYSDLSQQNFPGGGMGGGAMGGGTGGGMANGNAIGLKYDNSLMLVSSVSYTQQGYDTGKAVAVDASGSAYIMGNYGLPSPQGYSQGLRLTRNAMPDNSQLLTVAVGTSTPRVGVNVGLIPFPSLGSPDISFMVTGRTDSSGRLAAPVRPGLNYLVALSSPAFSPTVKDQIADPSGKFVINLRQPALKQYYLNPIPAANQGVTLKVALSGLVPGYSLMGEIFFTQTGERVAYGVFKATDTRGTMEIYNVPASAASMLSLAISVPGRLSMMGPIPFAIPTAMFVPVDMAAAMPPMGTYQAGPTAAVAFSGFVGDSSGNALKDARVQISSNALACPGGCPPVFQAETYTDINGRFTFPTVPWTQQYPINIFKNGYKIISGSEALPKMNAWYSLEKATYTLRGYVRYNGMPIPYAQVYAMGDCSNGWAGTDPYAGTHKCVGMESTAYTDGDGQFLLEGLVDGNVKVSVYKPVNMSVNDGPDGNMSTSADNLRITLSSAGILSAPAVPAGNPCTAGRAWVLDITGACKGVQPYIFNMQGNINASGHITGYATFTTTYTVTPSNPLVISRSSAVIIMANESSNTPCTGMCPPKKMGMTGISGTLTSDTTAYTIDVASGTGYYIGVVSNEWGKVSSFGGDLDLSSTDTARKDFNLVKSGSLSAKVKLPDGTIFKEAASYSPSAYIYAYGKNVSAEDEDNLDQTGNVKFPNLPAGVYKVSLKPNTTSFIWPAQVLEDINVVAGRNTDVVFSLEEGLVVQPNIFGLPEISTPTWDYLVIPLPSGTKMNQQKVTDLFFGKDQFAFNYNSTSGKWEAKAMPPGQYDFYLLLGSKFDCGKPGGSCHQFANFIGKSKNVSIQASETSPNLGTAAQPIPIEILGSIGQGSVSGHVKGAKIFTDADYTRLFAAFETEITGLIPAVMLYDTAGDFRGFAHAMPDETAIGPFETAVNNKSSAAISAIIGNGGMAYMVWGLPPGSYTAVFANPNYPPVPVNVDLPADEFKEFDFDAQRLAVGGISGIVMSSGAVSAPLPNTSVYLKHRTIEKLAKTDASGAFSFANLPPGIYRLEISRDGFITTGQKTSLAGSLTGSDNAEFAFYMEPSTASITGKVLLGGGLSGATYKAGIKVVAYDETLNINSPAAYLPKIQGQTNDAGGFELTGINPGHVYNISAVYPGKPIGKASVTAGAGVTALDGPIVLVDANPQVTVKLKKSADSDRKVDVIIKSPKALLNAPRCAYNMGVAYDSSTAVSMSLRLDPDNTYVGKFTVSAGKTYNVHVEAFDDSMGNDFLKMVKNVIYDQTNEARTEQYIEQAASEGGEINLDAENEEYSGIELDAGTLTASTGTADLSGLVGGFFSSLPSVRTVKTAKGNASLASAIQSLMASEVYNFDLANVQGNKPFTLTLKYDKERGLNSGALRIYQYDASADAWVEVPGNYTVDPMTGVVSVDVRSLDGAYRGTDGTNTPLERKQFHMSAVSGGRYVPSAAASSTQSGKFAVFSAKPPTGTAAFSRSFEVYNLPNPFSLKAKTVNISADGQTLLGTAYTTYGTLIKYNMPLGKAGNLKFVIYNLAGEKVRTIDEGNRPANQVYYSEWDGRNDNGEKCASGVYFMLPYLDGKKLGNKAHKMAIIK